MRDNHLRKKRDKMGKRSLVLPSLIIFIFLIFFISVEENLVSWVVKFFHN